MVLIYFPFENTNRLDYVAGHLFRNILGVDCKITSRREDLTGYMGPVINYSSEKIDKTFQIIPFGLLTEKGISPIHNLYISNWKEIFIFFASEGGEIPFDIFSASFYLLTLYEEHFPEKLDEHGRFCHTESLLFRNNMLEIPVVDRWAYLLKEQLEKAGYNTLDFKLREYKTISTYDVDHPYAYRNRGLIKNTGGALKDIFAGKLKAVKDRSLVQLRIREDPYFKALKVINEIQAKFNKPYYLFVLLGRKGKYGISTAYSPKKYYEYIQKLDLLTIGLHPSYDTLRNLEQLIKEKTELESILGHKVDISRQHFLRMQIPETFQELNLAGIREDFSLAFAKTPGFRSGTAVPYNFYEIRKDEQTQLLVRPTVLMDTTMITHLALTPMQTLQRIKKLIDECKQSGGDYLSLWHNSNLAYSPQKNPWISVFVQSYKYAIGLENK